MTAHGQRGRRRRGTADGPGRVWPWLTVGALALAPACASGGAFDPQGPQARRLLNLFWVSLGTASVVAVVVSGLLLYAMFRRRPDPGEGHDEVGERFPATRFIVVGGLVIPSLVLMAMLGFTVATLAGTPQSGDVRIEVVGHQFWWEATYPEQPLVATRFETANEIHVPVGRPVELTLRSEDVIHSLWVPQLGGKVDMIPGRDNTLVLQADRPGVYRGKCAEYCGLAHATMQFLVVAQPADAFRRWAADQARPAQQPATDDARAGRQAFVDGACAGCHAVRGTPADGELGPDLTHLASRRTLGAGIVPNDHEHLTTSVANIQQLKPGNEMPPMEGVFTDRELADIVAYLESLR